MSDIPAELWQKEMDDARAMLRQRFPNLCCLRCGKDKFFMRIWPDESLVPGLASPDNNRVLELICESCGHQEKHVVNLLEKTEAA